MPAAPSLSQPPTRLKLASPAEVLAAVPYLIGFEPERSVVVLCLRKKQLGLTMRLDLDTPTTALHEIILERVRADNADTALLVIFDPDAGEGTGRPGASIARSLIRALLRADIHVRDALGVRGGRFWSYLCRDTTCCPPGGRAVPVAGAADHSKVAATFVATGSAPLASREELSATLAEVSGERRAAIVSCLLNAVERPAAHPVDRWWSVVSRYCEGPPRPGGTLALAEAARLIVSLRDVMVRDEIISWTSGDALVGVLAVLRELAPLALAPFNTQVLATLAWAAYAFGDGALASMALERVLDADPEHTLAQLLGRALHGGIAPDVLRSASDWSTPQDTALKPDGEVERIISRRNPGER